MSDAADGKIRNVEDLEVFRRAYQVSLAVHKASLAFPQIEQRALADQLRRSSKSVCANIVEGFARQRRAPADYRRYLIMALGSSDETRLWLRYAVDLGHLAPETGLGWIAEYGEISRMLQAICDIWSRYARKS